MKLYSLQKKNIIEILEREGVCFSRREVEKSRERLFRRHERIKNGDVEGVGSIQSGLRQIKQEWRR
ncbi:MAG: hypothetical protein Q4A78_05130 [Peptostreptococcaceae bacterium]|nr:hypothetical protein [Peptostreptococcaceae bacterium]